MRKESAPNDETSLPQALQGREIARYLNRRFSIDCSDQLTGRSLVKVSSLERLHSQIAALAARSIMLSTSAAVPTASQPHLTALRLHFSDHRIFGSFARQACRCRHI